MKIGNILQKLVATQNCKKTKTKQNLEYAYFILINVFMINFKGLRRELFWPVFISTKKK